MAQQAPLLTAGEPGMWRHANLQLVRQAILFDVPVGGSRLGARPNGARLPCLLGDRIFAIRDCEIRLSDLAIQQNNSAESS